jgi:hypothetical protein
MTKTKTRTDRDSRVRDDLARDLEYLATMIDAANRAASKAGFDNVIDHPAARNARAAARLVRGGDRCTLAVVAARFEDVT